MNLTVANTLRSIVIEDAIQTFNAGQSHAPAYFYASRNPAEPTRSDPDRIFASIARQLSSHRPGLPLLNPTVELYREKEAQGFASGPVKLLESCDLIIRLIDSYPMTVIVIDALDECDPEKREKLFEALEKIFEEAPGLVKVFVSSRNDQGIVYELRNYPNLAINSDRNGDDIKTFVMTETKRLIKKRKLLQHSKCKDEMEALIIREVCNGATGM